MSKFKNIVGATFDNWYVLNIYQKGTNIQTKYLCKCTICNSNKVVARTSLVKGVSTKCRSCSASRSKRKWKTEKLRTIYKGIKQRCYDKKSSSYERYGKKGITICDEWLSDPLSFEKWALNNGYMDGLSIDRIDCNLGYSPSNCRWADITTQNNNRKNVHLITINNKTKSIAQWCKVFNVSYQTALWRYKHNYPTEKIFNL